MKFLKDVSRNNSVDRISQLPDPLCHHILSFLPANDAGRTVFLSRRWRSLWYSVPVYDFYDACFGARQSTFLMFLGEALTCRQKYFNNLSIHRFGVHMDMSSSFNPLVLNWITFSLKANVKELIINNYGNVRPTIPSTVCDAIFTARSITKLDIACLPMDGIPVSVNLPSLQELVLVCTTISEPTLRKLISACYVVRKISLQSLRGIEKIEISSETLMELNVSHCHDMEVSVGYAPNIEIFAYKVSWLGTDKTLPVLRKLTSLTLTECHMVTDSVVANILLENPLLEKLSLVECVYLKKLIIASPKLKCFSLITCKPFVEVQIDALSLVELECGGKLLTLTSVTPSPLLMARICLGDTGLHFSSTPPCWYANLKEMCEKLQHSKTLSVVCHEESDLIIPEEMRESLFPQLHAVKHLKVEITHSLGTSYRMKLEKGLLWMFPCLLTLDMHVCDWGGKDFTGRYEYKDDEYKEEEDTRQLLGRYEYKDDEYKEEEDTRQLLGGGGNVELSIERIPFRKLIRWLFIKARWLFIRFLNGC